jgi:hypothetical protein
LEGCFLLTALSARAINLLFIEEGFLLASYCCVDSLPKVILLFVFLGRIHVLQCASVKLAITPSAFATYLVPSESTVSVIKKGPLAGLAISDQGKSPASSVDWSTSITSSDALHMIRYVRGVMEKGYPWVLILKASAFNRIASVPLLFRMTRWPTAFESLRITNGPFDGCAAEDSGFERDEYLA